MRPCRIVGRVEFEWDEGKRESNFAKHSVDFADAIQVFRDAHRLWGYDEDHSDFEDRWWTIGLTHDTVLFVVTTRRNDTTRLISARKATRDEERIYYESRSR